MDKTRIILAAINQVLEDRGFDTEPHNDMCEIFLYYPNRFVSAASDLFQRVPSNSPLIIHIVDRHINVHCGKLIKLSTSQPDMLDQIIKICSHWMKHGEPPL